MAYLGTVGTFDFDTGVKYDAAGRLRVSTIKTLHDGKITNGHTPLIFESAGTGLHTLGDAKNNMAVDAGEWCVFTTKRNLIYSSGKSQIVEETFDKFAPQADVVKRVGYYDSTTVSPYETGFDGFWLETTDTSIKLVVKHADIVTPRQDIDITEWTGYEDLGGMKNPSNWGGFTVIMLDFLWLGGANLRLFVMTPVGWKLAHQYIHAGRNVEDTMIKQPCKPLRYEIRSTTGAGEFRYICSQGATEGDISDTGYTRSITAPAVTATTVGTVYPILGLRKNMTYRCTPVSLEDIGITPYSTNDRGLFTVQIKPTLSGALSWTPLANSSVEYAIGNGTVTVTEPGSVILSGTALTDFVLPSGLLDANFLAFLSQNLDGTADEYWICLQPQTASISMNASLTYKEF